jgi:protein-disulfide isomerase
MRSALLLAATAALFASACNAEQSASTSGGSAQTGQGGPVEPPPGGDWTKVVTQTEDGGFLMGNPNAAVKLVEYGSMTCPHCARFAETGYDPLVEKYVKPGRVSYEFRNFVFNPLDMAMSLVARCGGADRFFPLTDAMYANQRAIAEQVQQATPEQQQQLAALPPLQQLPRYAELAGLQQFAAQRGVPSARQQQCLTNQAEVDRLVAMTSTASSEYNVPGTPAFLINNELASNVTDWGALESAIKEALGS